MSLWRNKTNRTILISSIFLVLVLTLIVFLATFNIEKNPAPGLEWLFNSERPVANLIFTGLLFWAVYFNLLMIIGSIREKMNVLPGWTEVILSMILTILPSIFLGNLDNYGEYDWVVFGITCGGIILITLWFMMTSTPREEEVRSRT